VFTRKLMRALDSSKISNNGAAEPQTGCQNRICMSSGVGSQYGATTEAAESLTAQLDSQSKVATLRHENRKIQHENKILKAKDHAPYV
jgi:hypothetical protein